MAELGTYYITIMPSMNKFTGAVKSAMGDEGTKSAEKFSSNFLDVLKGSALGTMVGNLASSLGGQLMEGIDIGIKRIDTLKNYPRVMEALGYSTQEADDSVQLIMKHLDGLPTTTQDMVTLTQSIADSTGDLDLATRAALGFNDMMLANGASAGEMTQAMGVFNRVLGKGNATTAQWMSLQSVMPAQLNMVARELMGESASAEDLREARNNGEISWNDCLRAIVRLDEEGTGSVASFTDQARANVDGIGTALVNLPNRIGQGWAAIFDAIGRSNISKPINELGYGIKAAMEQVAGGISYIMDKLKGTKIAENAAKVFQTIGEALSALWQDGGPEMLREFADAFIEMTDGALQWMADHGDTVKVAIMGIVGAIGALLAFNFGTWLANFQGLIAPLFAALAANPFGALVIGISAVVMALYGFFTQTETGKQMWQDFCTILSDLWTGLQEDAAYMLEVLQREWESFKEWVAGIPEFWGGIVAAILAKGGEFAAWWQQSWQEAADSCKRVWDSIKTAVTTAWGDLIGWVLNKGAEFRQWWDKSWQEAFDSCKKVWDDICNTVTTIMDNITTGISDGVNAALDTVTSVFDDIKDAITDRINDAKDAVSRAIDAIKSLFNFQISWPHIPLPHFSVSGSPNPLDWLTMGVPSISIDWYAKGGVFDAPTIIGIGEAGREAALPMNARVYGEIARGIQQQMGASGPQILITGNEFNVRDEEDIERIGDELSAKILRQMGAAA